MADHQLVALLSWFDEQPTSLRRLIESLPIAHVTHLVALDGRYQLFGCDYDESPADQAATIRQACADVGIGCTIDHIAPCAGNEVEKRTALFALAETVTTPDDHYLVMDGDESVISAPPDLLQRLADSPHDCAEAQYIQPGGFLDLRKVFRAIRGLAVEGNHFTYMTPDGRALWGRRPIGLEPAIEDLGLEVTHHISERHPMRDLRRMRYYRDRDRQRIET